MLAHRHAGQIQEDGGDLTPHRDTLHRLARTFPDTWLRHRANELLLVANGLSRTEAARRVGCTSNSLRNWAHHLLTDERGGLADRPCIGRPPKLDQAAPALLDTALTTPPGPWVSGHDPSDCRVHGPGQPQKLGCPPGRGLSQPAPAGLPLPATPP